MFVASTARTGSVGYRGLNFDTIPHRHSATKTSPSEALYRRQPPTVLSYAPLLQRRMVPYGNRAITEVLVKWRNLDAEAASWEAYWGLIRRFPYCDLEARSISKGMQLMQTPLLRPLQTLGKELSCLLLFYYRLLLGLAAVIVSSSLLIVWICDMRGKHFEEAKAIDLGPLLLLAATVHRRSSSLASSLILLGSA